MNVKGQAAIVTGGASGLGAATAGADGRGRRRQGGHRRPAGRSRREAVAKELGGRFVRTDVFVGGRRQGRGRAAALKEFGALRVVVNCAGIGRAARTVGKDGPPGSRVFRKVIEVNLIGTFNVHPARGRTRWPGAGGRRRARRHRQHRLGGRVRRADRPGRLQGVEGRHRRDDAADRARSGPQRHPRQHHRAGDVRDADARGLPEEAQVASARRCRSRRGWATPTEYAALSSTSSRTRC